MTDTLALSTVSSGGLSGLLYRTRGPELLRRSLTTGRRVGLEPTSTFTIPRECI